ncbi:MAG TPA: hypothetical protein PKN95_06555 [Verrucomicrobiota bacterium]|nr:hypothetical protein [Verrucomicrobiota bacterium]HNT14702.1 hypothetical protein [Verrucomicrobiota bacterium]
MKIQLPSRLLAETGLDQQTRERDQLRNECGDGGLRGQKIASARWEITLAFRQARRVEAMAPGLN